MIHSHKRLIHQGPRYGIARAVAGGAGGSRVSFGRAGRDAARAPALLGVGHAALLIASGTANGWPQRGQLLVPNTYRSQFATSGCCAESAWSRSQRPTGGTLSSCGSIA